MDEAARAMGVCEFCNALGSLLCDGKVDGGKTCDKRMCRAHAHRAMHLSIRTKLGCRTDSRDLCPDCIAAGRKT